MKARRKMMPTQDLFFCRDNEAKCKQLKSTKPSLVHSFILTLCAKETLVLQVFKNNFIWCLLWHYTSALYCNCIKLEPTQSCIPTWRHVQTCPLELIPLEFIEEVYTPAHWNVEENNQIVTGEFGQSYLFTSIQIWAFMHYF